MHISGTALYGKGQSIVVAALQVDWDEEQDPEYFRLGGSVPQTTGKAAGEAGALRCCPVGPASVLPTPNATLCLSIGNTARVFFCTPPSKVQCPDMKALKGCVPVQAHQTSQGPQVLPPTAMKMMMTSSPWMGHRHLPQMVQMMTMI